MNTLQKVDILLTKREGITSPIEIYGRLVRYKLNSDKLFLGNDFKIQILHSLLKGCKKGFLHNKKMCVVGEWKTNILIG